MDNQTAPAPLAFHPMQNTGPSQLKTLPVSVALRAYEVYCRVYGAQEAMVTGHCRGGFSVGEIIAFLYAHSFPQTEWRARVDEAFEKPKGGRPMTDPKFSSPGAGEPSTPTRTLRNFADWCGWGSELAHLPVTNAADRPTNHPSCDCAPRLYPSPELSIPEAGARPEPPTGTCDCGRPLTMCSSCAVEDYQAAVGLFAGMDAPAEPVRDLAKRYRALADELDDGSGVTWCAQKALLYRYVAADLEGILSHTEALAAPSTEAGNLKKA